MYLLFQSKTDDSRDGNVDHVEVIKLPAHSASNGVGTTSSTSADDAPLNLCTKSRASDDGSFDKDRICKFYCMFIYCTTCALYWELISFWMWYFIARRKPLPKPRRSINSEPSPISSLSAMSQLFSTESSSTSPVPGSLADEDAESVPKVRRTDKFSIVK